MSTTAAWACSRSRSRVLASVSGPPNTNDAAGPRPGGVVCRVAVLRAGEGQGLEQDLAGDAVDVREHAAQVDGHAVGRGQQHAHLAVGGRLEGVVDLADGGVEGQHAVPVHHRPRARLLHLGEVAADEDAAPVYCPACCPVPACCRAARAGGALDVVTRPAASNRPAPVAMRLRRRTWLSFPRVLTRPSGGGRGRSGLRKSGGIYLDKPGMEPESGHRPVSYTREPPSASCMGGCGYSSPP
jgi:hypothetical protein